MVSKDDVENCGEPSYLAAKVGDKVVVVSDDAGSPWAARLAIERSFGCRSTNNQGASVGCSTDTLIWIISGEILRGTHATGSWYSCHAEV